MSELVPLNDADRKLAAALEYKPEEIAIIKNSVAKGTSNTELAYFLNVCKSQDLNPFNKEVWCYKDQKGNLIILAGRDGMLSKGQKNPRWNGMRSAVVYENDHFEMDIAQGKITHRSEIKNPGQAIGAYAIVFLQGGEPTIEWIFKKDYNKGFAVWKTNLADMLKKTAESKALKKAFGFSGIQVAEEWREVGSGKIEPVPEVEVLTQEEVNETESVNRTLAFIEANSWPTVKLAITPEELENPTILAAYNQKKAEQ